MAYEELGIDIGRVLNQEGQPFAYFSEKMNNVRQWYTTYDKELYAVIQALHYWRHYLMTYEFILYFNYDALKYIYSQKKLNMRHERWI